VVDEGGFSRDRRRLWAKGVSTPIRVWNLSDGKEVAAITHPGGINRAIALSPNGQELVTGGYDGQVIIWDLATGKKASEQRFYDTSVARLAMSPTEYVFATGGQDGIIRRFDRNRGMHLDPVIKLPASIREITFSPDGKQIAGICFNNSTFRSEAHIFDMQSGKKVEATPWHKGGMSALALAPQGLAAAAGSDDHRARLWRTDKTEPLFDLAHEVQVTRVLFTNDSHHLVTGTGLSSLGVFHPMNVSTNTNLEPANGLHIWDVTTGRAVGHELQQQSPVADLALSGNGTT
jgi:WD40 repeat protein